MEPVCADLRKEDQKLENTIEFKIQQAFFFCETEHATKSDYWVLSEN